MYAACLWCFRDLGRNAEIGAFPVGRRLAFDAARGRFWVICRKCGRWNLSPLEERWEAIEQCERLYRGTRVRVSTDEVGMARLREGLTLIRIGAPLRPEFAAWRYGRQLRWRRLRAGAAVGAGLVAVAAGAAGGMAIGLGGYAAYAAFEAGKWLIDGGPESTVARVPVEGKLYRVKRQDLTHARIFTDGDDRHLGLVLHHVRGVQLLRGPSAAAALGKLMPAINRFGANRVELDHAVEVLEHCDGAAEYVDWMLRHASRTAPVIGGLLQLPDASRLALEMALHEDAERRAMEGELRELERAWREAEEVAAIADDMFVPPAIREFIERHRGPDPHPGPAA